MRPWGYNGVGAGRERDREGIQVTYCGEHGVSVVDFGGGNAVEGAGVVPEGGCAGREDGERDEDL